MSLKEQQEKLRALLKGVSQGGPKQKKVQQMVGFAVFAVFIVSSILINSSVHAVFQGTGQYGYYGGTYGYKSTTTSSDAVPAASTSLSCTTTGVCTWTAPTTTESGTSIAGGGGGISFYYINYRSTSAFTTCSGGSQLTATGATKDLENVAAGTLYYVAVCAVDTNGNPGLIATTSFTSASASSSGSSSGGGGGSTTTAAPTSPVPTVVSPGASSSNPGGVSNNVDFGAEAAAVTVAPATRDMASEKTYEARAKTVLGSASASVVNFVTYGTPSTIILGAGERLGVLNSYRSAYGRVPSTEAQWSDVIKIANGRWPSETSAKAETRAKATFKTIYKHNANMTNANENAAVTVMAYGLRPGNRNLNSEKVAIKNFRGTFGRSPSLATDWDMVRAIAYSGAKR